MSSKAQYNQAIHVYKKRREKLREKYGIISLTKKRPIEYKKAVYNLECKIRTWKKAIKRIERYNGRVYNINKAISGFMGINIRETRRWSNNPDVLIARGIFAKYCLESGIPGPYLRAYLGTSINRKTKNFNRSSYETDIRRRFTRTFASNPKNKELYHRFLEYMQRED
jgi:hypothetical protein